MRLGANRGAASVRELAELGLDRYAVARLVKAGHLVRVRRDAVVDASLWREATPDQRHALRGRAVCRSLECAGRLDYALSHHSALAVHGIATYGVDDRVHLVRTDAQRGRVSDGTHVHPALAAAWTTRGDGVTTVRPAKAVLQVASYFGVEAGLVSADVALHEQGCQPGDLDAALASGGYGSGVNAARVVVALADARVESPGESRLRWLLHSMGRAVQPQVWITSTDGRTLGRVDFLLADAPVVIEFDGRLKYEDQVVLWNEKRREDAIRAEGYEVVRITWADLDHPARILALIEAACARADRRLRSDTDRWPVHRYGRHEGLRT